MKKMTLSILAGMLLAGTAAAEPQQSEEASALPQAERTHNTNAAKPQMMQQQKGSMQQAQQHEKMMAEPQPQSAAATDSKPAMAEQAGFSRGSVVRSTFTSSINEREPVDSIQKLENRQNNIYFFTELRDMSGQTAKHRWEYNGEVMAEVKFDVKGPRWRVWSSKQFQPGWTGEWKVSVLNGADEVISEKTLNILPADIQQESNTPQAAADTQPPAVPVDMQTQQTP